MNSITQFIDDNKDFDGLTNPVDPNDIPDWLMLTSESNDKNQSTNTYSPLFFQSSQD